MLRNRLMSSSRWLVVAAALGLAFGACSEQQADDWDDQWNIDGELVVEESTGKQDNAGVAGPPASHDSLDTQVWVVRNQWEDTDTAEAREAGLAWDANSGLNWDEKYSLWIQSMGRTPGNDTYYETFTLTTPWGKELPAPALECAEVAMFLRVTFASWFGLPFYLTATDGSTRIYFGHMGGRTKSGRYKDTPLYRDYYHDYTADMAGKTNQYIIDHWPSDSKLRERGLYGDGDDMPWLPGSGAKKAGQYFDQVYLNKRVGHFMRLLLSYFGSMHLASSRNTFNLKPQALRAGDVLIERWQKQGIGHVLVVKQVTPLEGGKLEANLASGSMPRRQPKWEDGAASKHTFTINECGGVGTNYEGDEYAKLGGGIKRFRVAKKVGGYWTNTWMRADEASWICDTDYERISARPAQFADLLGEVSPEQLRASYLQMVSDARNHLRDYPASCSARIRREDAFELLYALCAREWSMTKAQVDAQYRIFEDYVFAELEYTQSKTCCWNSSNSAMHQIVMDYNNERQQNGCQDAVVFKAMGGGYSVFRDFAESTGRGHLWRDWSADETCPQSDVDNDTEVAHEWTAFCDLGAATPTPDCSDSLEPNNNPNEAAQVQAGTYPDLEVCSGNDDYFAIDGAGGITARIEFTHASGDLDMELYQGTNKIGSSTSSSNSEEISAADGGPYILRVYGYSGAANTYTLVVSGGGGGGNPTCTDGFEPNGSAAAATAVSEGTYQNLQICPSDQDWYAITASAGQTIVVRAEFSHATGDLDMALYNAANEQVGIGQSTDDNEEISSAASAGTYTLKVYGYNGATAPYALVVDLQ
ncbi:MAG: PPC domain-containing protein [bacterium]